MGKEGKSEQEVAVGVTVDGLHKVVGQIEKTEKKAAARYLQDVGRGGGV